MWSTKSSYLSCILYLKINMVALRGCCESLWHPTFRWTHRDLRWTSETTHLNNRISRDSAYQVLASPGPGLTQPRVLCWCPCVSTLEWDFRNHFFEPVTQRIPYFSSCFFSLWVLQVLPAPQSCSFLYVSCNRSHCLLASLVPTCRNTWWGSRNRVLGGMSEEGWDVPTGEEKMPERTTITLFNLLVGGMCMWKGNQIWGDSGGRTKTHGWELEEDRFQVRIRKLAAALVRSWAIVQAANTGGSFSVVYIIIVFIICITVTIYWALTGARPSNKHFIHVISASLLLTVTWSSLSIP